MQRHIIHQWDGNADGGAEQREDQRMKGERMESRGGGGGIDKVRER